MQPFLLEAWEKIQKIFFPHSFVVYRFWVIVFLWLTILGTMGYFFPNPQVWFFVILCVHVFVGWGYFVIFRFQTGKIYLTHTRIFCIWGKKFSPKIQEIPVSTLQNISFLQKGIFAHMLGFWDLTFQSDQGKITVKRIENIEKTTQEIIALIK